MDFFNLDAAQEGFVTGGAAVLETTVVLTTKACVKSPTTFPAESGYIAPKVTFRFLIAGKAPAPVWSMKLNEQGQIINLFHKKPWPYVKHYSFHIMKARWGHIIIKMCGYPPFGLQIILNGHNWEEYGLADNGYQYVMDDNCFIEADQKALFRWSRALSSSKGGKEIQKVCEHWSYWCVDHFAVTKELRIRTGFKYRWSVYQLEMSRNYHFAKPAALDEVYQNIIDRTRHQLNVPKLKTIFGVRGRPRRRKNRSALTGERSRRDAVSCSVDMPEYNLTVFKVHWANRTLKLYDKGRRTLRGESVIHNVRALKIGRGQDNWTEVVKLMHESLIRFLDALDTLDVGLVDAGRLDYWKEPEQTGENRLAGIAIENARMRALLNSLMELSVHNHKVTRAELAAATCRKLTHEYTLRQASYDIRKLRAKGLLESVPKKKKYEINLNRLRELVGVIKLREQVLKRVCAIAKKYPPTGKRTGKSLCECYDDLAEILYNLFNVIHLEAST